MTADPLSQLREEHADGTFGPQLWSLLDRIVRSTAPTYPASEYSPDWVWSREAMEDLRQDWIEMRLVGRGDLAVMLASARSMGGLRSLLVRSLRQHLINTRRRSSASNLYSRLLKRLAAHDVVHLVVDPGSPSERGWALDSTQARPASGNVVEALLSAARQHSDEDLGVVRYGPASLKSSPILRNPQLDDFATRMLAAADGYVTTAELFTVLKLRFDLAELGPVELSNIEPARTFPVDEEVAARLIASSVVSRLGAAHSRILRSVAEHEYDLVVTAASLELPVSDVQSSLERKCFLVAEYAESYKEAIDIARRVDESLYVQERDL